MTPKEKAKELFDKIGKEISTPMRNGSGYRFDVNKTKQCALIAVDEMIKEYDTFFQSNYNKSYWVIVKQELQNLN